jgi:hypothetical protein
VPCKRELKKKSETERVVAVILRFLSQDGECLREPYDDTISKFIQDESSYLRHDEHDLTEGSHEERN